jgi:hypothetical protein
MGAAGGIRIHLGPLPLPEPRHGFGHRAGLGSVHRDAGLAQARQGPSADAPDQDGIPGSLPEGPQWVAGPVRVLTVCVS